MRFDQVLNLWEGDILPKLLEGVVHLSGRDFTSSLNVEHWKDAPQLLIIEESRSVDSCSQEFWVIDPTIASIIKLVNHRLDLSLRQIQILLINVGLDLVSVDQPSPVQVKCFELLSHLGHLFHWWQFDKDIHGGSLEVRLGFVLLQELENFGI